MGKSSRKAAQKSKTKVKVNIPLTPSSATAKNSALPSPGRSRSASAVGSPFQTPPTSPSSPSNDLPSMEAVALQDLGEEESHPEPEQQQPTPLDPEQQPSPKSEIYEELQREAAPDADKDTDFKEPLEQAEEPDQEAEAHPDLQDGSVTQVNQDVQIDASQDAVQQQQQAQEKEQKEKVQENGDVRTPQEVEHQAEKEQQELAPVESEAQQEEKHSETTQISQETKNEGSESQSPSLGQEQTAAENTEAELETRDEEQPLFQDSELQEDINQGRSHVQESQAGPENKQEQEPRSLLVFVESDLSIPQEGDQQTTHKLQEGQQEAVHQPSQEEEQQDEADPAELHPESEQQTQHEPEAMNGAPSNSSPTDVQISAKDIASKDIMAIADLFSTMKTSLGSMTSAFDRLGTQTEKMVSLSLDINAAEQMRQVKIALQDQIERHKTDVETLRNALQTKVKDAVEAKMRDQLRDSIRDSLKKQIHEQVKKQLSAQIPEDLRQQVISTQRQIIEVKTSLHNSEARRYNALQTVPGAVLRPLLRPLPTPEQSPVVIGISRSSSMGNSTALPTPATAFPQGPAPTPIRRSVSASHWQRPGWVAGGGAETVPPTPSQFFPRDLSALFALGPEDARRLLREYGLSSATASPATEHPTRPRGLSIVNEESTDAATEDDVEAHAQDMNTFMAHIGVPFLMIPPPKEKCSNSDPAPLSSKSRRKLLTPLIIK